MKLQKKKCLKIPETQALRLDPKYFIKQVFNYKIALPHYNILTHYEQARETLDLGPRGCGKTLIGNIGYSTWLAANNPNIRILILSDTDKHAIRFLGVTKAALGMDPVIRKYYGALKGDIWTDHELVIATRTDKTLMEATISAMGMYSGAVTSGHYDVIIADDLINFDNSRTEGMRERTDFWFKTTVLPTLLPGGEIRCQGTRYHYNDVWNMVQNELGFDTQIQQAIIEEGTLNERSIWETHMPLHTKIVNGKKIKGLIEIRDGDKQGSGIGTLIFNLQYQNNVDLQKKGDIFQYNWFKFTDNISDNLRIYQGIDLAISKSDTAAFFVVLTLGIDQEGNIYVLDIFRERGISFNSQRETIIKKAEEWKPLRIGIETNAYQEVMAQEVKRLTLLPVLQIHTVKDKTMRAQSRSGLVEGGRVNVKTNMHTFVSELVMMPDGKYKDQFDAFDFALTVSESAQQSPLPAYESLTIAGDYTI
jgi:phage terminase large subunit-like protein